MVSYQWGWCGAAGASPHWLSELRVSMQFLIKWNWNVINPRPLSPLAHSERQSEKLWTFWAHSPEACYHAPRILSPNHMKGHEWCMVTISKSAWDEWKLKTQGNFLLSVLIHHSKIQIKKPSHKCHRAVSHTNDCIKCAVRGYKLRVSWLDYCNQDISNSWTVWNLHSGDHMFAIPLCLHSFL